jgi:hypothetical protein
MVSARPAAMTFRDDVIRAIDNLRPQADEAISRVAREVAARILRESDDRMFEAIFGGTRTSATSERTPTADEIKRGIEEAMASMPPPAPDPFRYSALLDPPSRLFGMDVIEHKPRIVPKIEVRDIKVQVLLEHDLAHWSVPVEHFSVLSPKFRAEINDWLRETFGTRDETIIPRGQMFILGGRHIVARSDDLHRLTS